MEIRISLAMLLALACGAVRTLAGGSGLNVAVVVNQASSNSVQLGNYYCERRAVPPQNLLRIDWVGSPIEWTRTDCETHLLTPLNEMLASRGLSNQVDYVVLSMGIPYRVVNGGNMFVSGVNGTTSFLFYGFKPDYQSPHGASSCTLPDVSFNPYAGSELPFRSVTNGSAWLAIMLTASNLPAAKAIVDRGVISDGMFPAQKVFLTKSTDTSRNVRYELFDRAILDTQVLGRPTLLRTNLHSSATLGYQLGSINGSYSFSLGTNLFAPGAMADNLTSFSGQLFESTGMTGVREFLAAGATASYGPVIEPCAYLGKFPSPQNYLYQGRGFSIAECYYQSVTNPYQGILVGEPLAAPFGQPSEGAWLGLSEGALLSGATNLSLQFITPDLSRPVQQVDLFLDGTWLRTLTNIAPRQNNVLTATINGHSIPYTVPASATLKSVASGLTAEINKAANTNVTRVRALSRGDRVELQSFEMGRPGHQVVVTGDSATGSAPALTTFLTAARTNLLDTVACGLRGFTVTNSTGSTVPVGAFLQFQVTKTNGAVVSVAVTNTVSTNRLFELMKQWTNAVGSNPDLQAADGVVIEDVICHEDWPYSESWFYGTNDHSADFNVRARSPGWLEAQVEIALSGSTGLTFTPPGTNRLDANAADFPPRNHLYITAGATNLPLTFALDTTTLADGFHELTAVAYEGSHVRTQKRVSQAVRITNSPLAATFTTRVGGSHTLVTATLEFAVAANTNTIARIELFSTGGLLAAATNQASATFQAAGTNLHVGLHPFHAVVTRTDGKQYRTETHWIRLLAVDYPEPPFALTVTAPPPVLSWPATVARTYEVLTATNLSDPFTVRDTLVATNSPATWTETSTAATRRFYRVRSVP